MGGQDRCWQSVTCVNGSTGVCQKSNAEEQMLQLDLLSSHAGVHAVGALLTRRATTTTCAALHAPQTSATSARSCWLVVAQVAGTLAPRPANSTVLIDKRHVVNL